MKYTILMAFLYMAWNTKAQDTTYYLVDRVEVRILEGENLNVIYSSNLSDRRKEFIHYKSGNLWIDQQQFNVGEQEPQNMSTEVQIHGRVWLLDLIADERGGELSLMDENGNVVMYKLAGMFNQ